MAKKIVLILAFLFAFSFALDAAPKKPEAVVQEAEPDQQMNDFSFQGLSQGGKRPGRSGGNPRISSPTS